MEDPALILVYIGCSTIPKDSERFYLKTHRESAFSACRFSGDGPFQLFQRLQKLIYPSDSSISYGI